jgi:hypothetical protein
MVETGILVLQEMTNNKARKGMHRNFILKLGGWMNCMNKILGL